MSGLPEPAPGSPSEPIRLRAPARDLLADLFGADYLLLFAGPTAPLRWMCHQLHLDTELHLQIPPLPLVPAIEAGDPGGGAGIDAAVERLVAFAQLLPFEPGEAAAGLHRHQLFADQLLDPFGVDA